ncbi:MAG: cupin domain-containing protein [Halobacteriota archaeon]
MGYHVIDPTTIDPLPDRSATARPVSERGNLETLGIRFYDAHPGEQLPLAYHYHETQEEAFYVLDGELHVETPAQTFAVSAGELFVVEAGSPHRAYNPDTADTTVRVLAMGAPSDDSGVPHDPEVE